MPRLELRHQTLPGTAVRLFLVICPALIVGALLGTVVLVALPSTTVPYIGLLVVAGAGIVAGLAAGLLIAPPPHRRQPLIIAAVIDVIIVGVLSLQALARASAASLQPLPWGQLPLPILIATAIQLLLTWGLWAAVSRRTG